MAKSIEKDGFKVEVLPGKLRVASLEFSPAEADKVTGLLSWAGNMASMSALPPTVGHNPFVIHFNNSGIHVLVREGQDSGVDFKFNQIDELVNIIGLALQISKNLLDVSRHERLSARGRIGAVGANAPDIIEGRG